MKVQNLNFFYLAPQVSPSSSIEYDCTTPGKYGKLATPINQPRKSLGQSIIYLVANGPSQPM
uniref:Uncharacterized protein n=1 Tax=Setaria italica TaxID=4555 RepID=K3YY13_SETIT